MTPDTDSTHREIQELLPWWTNGTLPPEESRLVEAHLERCVACRREALLLTELEGALDEAPAAGPARVGEAGELGASGRAPVAAHRPRSADRPGRPVLPWLGWAAAAVLAVALGLQSDLDLGSGPGADRPEGPVAGAARVVPTYRLDTVRRSSADMVTIPGGTSSEAAAGELQLLLHVDLGPGALPLDLALLDSEGRTVLREPGIDSLYEGRFLFIRLATSELPPGRYLVVLRGGGPDAPEEPLRYSFRVVEGAGPEGKGSP